MTTDKEPERGLWCAVINQAITDATFRPSSFRVPKQSVLLQAARMLMRMDAKASNISLTKAQIYAGSGTMLMENPERVKKFAREQSITEQVRIRDTARKWLTEDSRDFRDVCWLSGMDPDSVRDKARHLAAAHWLIGDQTKKRLRQYSSEETV